MGEKQTIAFSDTWFGWHCTLGLGVDEASLEDQIAYLIRTAQELAHLPLENRPEIVEEAVNHVLGKTPDKIKDAIDLAFLQQFDDFVDYLAKQLGIKDWKTGPRRRLALKPGAHEKCSDATLRRVIAKASLSVGRMEWSRLATAVRLQHPDLREQTAGSLRLLALRRLGASLRDLKAIRKRTQSHRQFVREIVELKANKRGQIDKTGGIRRTA